MHVVGARVCIAGILIRVLIQGLTPRHEDKSAPCAAVSSFWHAHANAVQMPLALCCATLLAAHQVAVIPPVSAMVKLPLSAIAFFDSAATSFASAAVAAFGVLRDEKTLL